MKLRTIHIVALFLALFGTALASLQVVPNHDVVNHNNAASDDIESVGATRHQRRARYLERVRDTVPERFIPTNEWQEIKEGQSIPRGLHIEIDVNTGIRRARLP
eukprot:Awhi_evm1s13787